MWYSDSFCRQAGSGPGSGCGSLHIYIGTSSHEGAFAQDAGTKYDVVLIRSDHGRHGGDETRRILIVGMKHHDDIGAAGKRGGVACLLVAAITQIPVMPQRVNAEAASKLNRLSELASSVSIISSTTSLGIDRKYAAGSVPHYTRAEPRLTSSGRASNLSHRHPGVKIYIRSVGEGKATGGHAIIGPEAFAEGLRFVSEISGMRSPPGILLASPGESGGSRLAIFLSLNYIIPSISPAGAMGFISLRSTHPTNLPEDHPASGGPRAQARAVSRLRCPT